VRRDVTHTVDLELSRDLKRFGGFDIDACFNCGNCTAVCQLSEESAQFPRRLVRYGQLGMRDRLLAAKEAWLCWSCRDCSDTCPRQAKPSEYLEAVRRYAIASMDPTGLSRLMHTSTAFLIGFALALAALFAGILLSGSGTPASDEFDLFGYIPMDVIHNLGVAVLAAVGLVAATSAIRLVLHLRRTFASAGEATDASVIRDGSRITALAAIGDVLDEMVKQRRFRTCTTDVGRRPYLRSWFVHYCIMWGFIGLGLATVLDFMFKAPGDLVPLWYPSRLLGTVAGLALMYGTAITIWRRQQGTDSTQSRLLSMDWLFLDLLFVVGFTGFVLELIVYVPALARMGYGVFLVHVVLAMELMVLFPFSKFAHALYRPLAYGLHRMSARRPAVDASAESHPVG
jgi:NAD-dependent dihydropyrimidine dehydrogenase PreA subunit